MLPHPSEDNQKDDVRPQDREDRGRNEDRINAEGAAVRHETLPGNFVRLRMKQQKEGLLKHVHLAAFDVELGGEMDEDACEIRDEGRQKRRKHDNDMVRYLGEPASAESRQEGNRNEEIFHAVIIPQSPASCNLSDFRDCPPRIRVREDLPARAPPSSPDASSNPGRPAQRRPPPSSGGRDPSFPPRLRGG